MKLVADGSRRRFYYEVPRQGLRELSVKSGTLLFDGQRVGMTYRGTQYVFPRSCGRVGFPVSGRVAPDEHSVTLYGKAALRGSKCEPAGWFPRREASL